MDLDKLEQVQQSARRISTTMLSEMLVKQKKTRLRGKNNRSFVITQRMLNRIFSVIQSRENEIMDLSHWKADSTEWQKIFQTLRTVQQWNLLPREMVSGHSLDIFKTMQKPFVRDALIPALRKGVDVSEMAPSRHYCIHHCFFIEISL